MASCVGGAIEKIHDKLTIKVTVMYLDGGQVNFPVKCHMKGDDLYNNMFKHLNLLEREYFGLQFVHQGDDVVWVEPDKLFRKQWNDIKDDCECPDPIVKFKVRFYAKDPSQLGEAKTRHLYYLQIKSDIFEGALPCPVKYGIQLGSFIAQCELGDYIAIGHEPGYLNDLQLSRGQNEEFERRVSDLHKLHRGLKRRDAEIKYLEIAKKLDMYGVHLYRGTDSSCKNIQLGVTLAGLVIYNDGVRINSYDWCKMIKATFKNKSFVILNVQRPCEECSPPFKFSMDSRGYAKSFWKIFNNNYTFSRREISGPVVNNLECKETKSVNKQRSLFNKIKESFTGKQCKRFPPNAMMQHNKLSHIQDELQMEKEYKRDAFDEIFHSSLSLLCEGVADGVLDERYRKIPRKNRKFPITDGKLGDNPEKNYRDNILPYDCNRIVLRQCEPRDNYINASYVNLDTPSGTINRYIATQGPLTNTTFEFWRMVQQENCHLIVMLTAVMEQGVHKCHQYWPELDGELELSVGFSVKCTVEQSDETGSYVFRELVLIDKYDEQVERTIEHMQFLAWPDDGVPTEPLLFLQFRQRVNDIRLSTKAPKCIGTPDPPMIVHCTAGISRTGVFILVDTALNMLKAFEPIYPTEILETMRDQRSGFIQNTKLFRFACECICDEYAKLIHEIYL